MAVRQGFGALAEFALCEHSDDVAVTTPVVGADTLSVVTPEAVAIQSLLARSESVPLSIGSAVTMFSVLGRTDTAATLFNEVLGIATVLTTRSDTVAPDIVDVSSPRALLSRGEVLAPSLSEAVWTIAAALTRADELKLIFSRLETGPGFGAMAEFAHGEHGRDRGGQTLFEEGLTIFARLTNRTDELAPALIAVVDLLAVLAPADTIRPKPIETDARAEERLHRRIINIIHY